MREKMTLNTSEEQQVRLFLTLSCTTLNNLYVQGRLQGMQIHYEQLVV